MLRISRPAERDIPSHGAGRNENTTAIETGRSEPADNEIGHAPLRIGNAGQMAARRAR
jgi:hypothetical protein